MLTEAFSIEILGRGKKYEFSEWVKLFKCFEYVKKSFGMSIKENKRTNWYYTLFKT